MSIDLKTQTADTTITSTALMFGADSSTAASPSVYPIDTIADYIKVKNGSSAGGVLGKADYDTVGFTSITASTISVKAGTLVDVAGTIVSFAADTAVIMPALTAGTDYAIYACGDGSIRADVSFTAPTGYTAANSRKIGGFHYAPGGNAAGQAGGDVAPAINPYSVWDLKWRPACGDPRGMALIDGSFWCDIYLTGVSHILDGTSKFGATIADGTTPAKIPVEFGGNGSNVYASFNWWQANEVVQSHGKDLLSYGESSVAFYGVTEGTNAPGNADPVNTKLDAARTSRWGIMQATGNMWIWSRDFSYRPDSTNPGWNWKDQAGARGQLYLNNDFGLTAAMLGGSWGDGVIAGSRSSRWASYPWFSAGNFGARGRCDHLRLV
jgi:hypothetical protein